MLKKPENMTLTELRPYMAEFIRRKRKGKTARPAIHKLCPKCGKMTTARQRRLACPHKETE